MASKSFTVAEYSDTVVKKYLQHAFSDNPQDNLTSAAEEIYVLLRKLMDAANPVDVKAPLKSIRNGIESFASSPGRQPKVEELFCLYSRLQELCVERTFNGTDPAGAEQVQDVLRYRLTRLLVGDTWDARPALKLRVLQLIFSFMVRENERLLEEGRDVPSLRLALGRSLSIGRRGSRDLGPRRHSKWQEALSEVGRMQGSKLLPLVKLLLMENMQLADAAHAGAVNEIVSHEESPATPGKASPAQPSEPSGAALPAGAPHTNLDDLLGLNAAPSEQGDEPPSRRSSSPAVSTPGDDPFAALAEGRHTSSSFPGSQGDPAAGCGAGQEAHVAFSNMSIISGGGAAAGGFGPRPGSPTGSLSSTHTGSIPLPGVQSPPGYQQQSPYFMTGNNLQSYGSGPLPPMPSPTQTYGSGSSSAGAYVGFQPTQQASSHTKPASSASFPANFDANSPYLGQPHPFEDSSFKDISPVSRSHNSAPSPPHAPPMRTNSK